MTTETLHLLLQEELARLQLRADYLLVSVAEREQWHVHLHMFGRSFELGCAFHDGFFCRQLPVSGPPISYVPADARPIQGPTGRLVRCGLQLIVSSMDPNGKPVEPAVL